MKKNAQVVGGDSEVPDSIRDKDGTHEETFEAILSSDMHDLEAGLKLDVSSSKASLIFKDLDAKEASKPANEHGDIPVLGCTRPPNEFRLGFYSIFIEPLIAFYLRYIDKIPSLERYDDSHAKLSPAVLNEEKYMFVTFDNLFIALVFKHCRVGIIVVLQCVLDVMNMNLRRPIEKVMFELERKLSEMVDGEVVLWVNVQPKAGIDLQFESTKLSTYWSDVNTVALSIATSGTIALLSGLFLNPGNTWDAYIADLVLLFSGFISILGASELTTTVIAADDGVKLVWAELQVYDTSHILSSDIVGGFCFLVPCSSEVTTAGILNIMVIVAPYVVSLIFDGELKLFDSIWTSELKDDSLCITATQTVLLHRIDGFLSWVLSSCCCCKSNSGLPMVVFVDASEHIRQYVIGNVLHKIFALDKVMAQHVIHGQDTKQVGTLWTFEDINTSQLVRIKLVFAKKNGYMVIDYDIIDEKANVDIAKVHAKKSVDKNGVGNSYELFNDGLADYSLISMSSSKTHITFHRSLYSYMMIIGVHGALEISSRDKKLVKVQLYSQPLGLGCLSTTEFLERRGFQAAITWSGPVSSFKEYKGLVLVILRRRIVKNGVAATFSWMHYSESNKFTWIKKVAGPRCLELYLMSMNPQSLASLAIYTVM